MKLTIKNYKETTKSVDFKKLPEAAREAHKEFDSFADFYDEDKDIKEMLDNHFKIVEPYLKKSSPKSKKWKIIFTDAGGWIIASNKNEMKFGDYRTVAQIDRNTGSVSWVIPKIEVPDDVLIEIKNFGKSIAQKNKSGAYPIEDERKSKATAKKRVSKPKKLATKKKSVTKKAKRKAHEVALMPLELKIIKRYLNLHSKRVTERQVSLLYKVIQKAATEKTIRKTSKYADEIKKIGNDLAKTYKEMNNTCSFEVPDATYEKLKALVDSYGVIPAISLIKRFISLYGRITIDKAKRLLTSINNAKKNGKVSSQDKSYDRIIQVQKHLEDYLDSDKLLVTKIQLNGLKGLAGLGK